MLSTPDSVALIGLCGVVIAGILKVKVSNGVIKKDVCNAKHDGINQRLDSIDTRLSNIEKKL